MASIRREYDEAAAKAAYIDELHKQAKLQDLTQDLTNPTRNLSIAFTVIGVFFVGLRFLARKRQGVHIGYDDYLMIFAMILLLGNFIFNMILLKQGVGKHSGALTVDELATLNKTLVGAEIVYVTAVNVYKISLLFLYNRIFPLRSIRLGSYICGGLSTAWNLACIFAATFQCNPRAKIWEPWRDGFCIDLFLTQLCISIPTIMCDVAILALPIPHVWKLQTNRTQRILITGIFLLGSYVVFTSCYRFYVYLHYSKSDIPYTLAMPIAWNIIEVSSGIVSACLPTLGPLVRLVFTSLYPSSMQQSHGHGYSKTTSNGLQTIGGTGQPSTRSGGWNNIQSGHMNDSGELGVLGPSKPVSGVNVTISYNRDKSGDDSSNDEIPLTSVSQQKRGQSSAMSSGKVNRNY
ncbi:hypothetical protein BGZ63DRAFT_393462 [Mariannaea sp. PMI_226]|nr:hypothetical protein BGZ63DRAFT_393462 [Mariannaea sp. PMI_226]